jgi:hypothetical protein
MVGQDNTSVRPPDNDRSVREVMAGVTGRCRHEWNATETVIRMNGRVKVQVANV